MNSARSDLRLWQESQKAHDSIYHPEIAHLELSRRIAHLVLHMSKYAGALMLASRSRDIFSGQRNLIDAAIIAVSASTALKVDLSIFIENLGCNVDQDFLALSECLQKFEHNDFLSDFVIEVGRLAKAAEAVDHMEAFPIRETWNSGFARIFVLTAAEASRNAIDLRHATAERLQSVRGGEKFINTAKAGMPHAVLER